MAALSQDKRGRGAGLKFRPCIDLHSGKVKQIVGSTLSDKPQDQSADLVENFVASQPASFFAKRYREEALPGGHVIMLGKGNEAAATEALREFPGGLQVGGGITPENALRYIEAGASHVIVTSYVFKDGAISFDRLQQMVSCVGKERLVLDLSCRRKPEDGPAGSYYVVTDRWQKFTDFPVNRETLELLAQHCDEFLVHGVEVEGKRCGILEDLVDLLGAHSPIPVTYAGGVSSMDDVVRVDEIGKGRVDLTIGSALDLFGGSLPFAEVVAYHRRSTLTHMIYREASVRAAGVTAASLRTKWAHMLPPSKGVLAFYSHSKGAYRSFSNFFVHEGFAFVIPVCCRSAAFTESSRPPVVEGVRFSEKAIMLCKAAAMGDIETFDLILKQTEPRKTKALGRRVKPFDPALWDRIVCEVALQVVLQKFSSVPGLKAELLATGEALLAEATRNDTIWAIGMDVGSSLTEDPRCWNGTNILGWALMETRALIGEAGAIALKSEV